MKVMVGIAAIFLTATAVDAEIIQIVSGEHENFTRLVFEVEPSLDWTLETKGTSAELTIKGQTVSFDDADVFKRIPKTRLTATTQISNNDRALYRMELACECEVNAFAYQGRYIVVDIKDPVKILPLDSVYESVVAVHKLLPMPVVSQPLDMSPVFTRETAQNLPNLNRARGERPLTPPQDNPSTEGHQNEATPVNDMVIEARDKLLEQLTFAVEAGLVDLDGPNTLTTTTESIDNEVPLEAETTGISEANEIPTSASDQFEITNVYELNTSKRAANVNQGLNNCPTDEQLDIGSWGSEESFSFQLADLRGRLMTEFDQPDANVVQELVKLYIRYGFGVEAVSYLSTYEGIVQDSALLEDMAATIDNKPASKNGPLRNAFGCGGAAGLWHVIGADSTEENDIPNIDSVIEAFAELPPLVRRLVGPQLSEKLSEQGFNNSSKRINDILERAPGDHGDFHLLNVAASEQEDGEILAAQDIYENISETNSEAGASALINLAQMLLDQGMDPPPTLLADLGAAADELRGTDEGMSLRRLESLWLSKIYGGNEALKLIGGEMESEGPDIQEYREIASEIMLGMSPGKDGQTEYVYALVHYGHLFEQNDDLLLDVGQKLVQTGVPNMAVDILRPLVDLGIPDAIIISAEALIADYKPERSLSILDNVEGMEASKLRIQALFNIGSFERAYTELELLNENSPFSPDLLWYTGDWAEIVERDRFAREIFGKFFTPELAGTSLAPQVGTPHPSLSDTRALLNQSKISAAEIAAVVGRD